MNPAENSLDFEGIDLLGFAYAYILDDRDGLVPTDNAATFLEIKLLPREQEEIEAWIVIAAAASALATLSVLIFGLYKVTFNLFLQLSLTLNFWHFYLGFYLLRCFLNFKCIFTMNFSAGFSSGKSMSWFEHKKRLKQRLWIRPIKSQVKK